MFGSLLDREAGFFRFAPFGINHPTARAYVPGTNILETTWKTPNGWIVVRDALTMGPRDQEDTDHSPHAAAGGRRRRPPARANGRVPGGQRRGRARLRAGLRLRAHARGVDDGRRRPPRRRRDRGRADRPPAVRPRTRHRGRPRSARGTCSSPGTRAYCALSWAEGLAAPENVDEAEAQTGRDHSLLARLAAAGADPGSPLARSDPALGADDQGAHVHADRRDRRRADDLTAGDAGRRAQLGLPLHLDPRQHLHAPGAALAEPGLGGRRVHAVRRRRRADRGRLAADHVRDRRPARPDRDHA